MSSWSLRTPALYTKNVRAVYTISQIYKVSKQEDFSTLSSKCRNIIPLLDNKSSSTTLSVIIKPLATKAFNKANQLIMSSYVNEEAQADDIATASQLPDLRHRHISLHTKLRRNRQLIRQRQVCLTSFDPSDLLSINLCTAGYLLSLQVSSR
jgi:hypothetical protein